MRHHLLTFLFFACALALHAGVTTYEFTSLSWASRSGATVCDGVTDGWVSNQNASEYMTGRTDANGVLYSQGVSVKTGTSGAGATSVRSFTDVRRITFNFCQNSSKGRGTIYVQVGQAPIDSIVIAKPATSGSGVWLRDSTICLATPASGNIRFWITCSENAINLNSITIRAAEGGNNPFTTDSYQLVTSTDQLQDSDLIIIGVHQSNINYIMGYFDEEVSQNNIHAIRGHYSTDRLSVEENDWAVYTLHRGTTNSGVTAWYIEDEWRYGEAFLVASGGQTKNRLALWDKLYDSKTYGNYGYWDIQVAPNGEATIMNLGNSAGKYLQYNAVNSPTLFGCYATLSQTPVCIYRRVEAIGDVPAIDAPMVNFGEQVFETATLSGSRSITINANRLSEDITATLLHGDYFSLSTSSIDRDGDHLTISYSVTQAGDYVDTLQLTSGTITKQVPVMLSAITPMSIAEAALQKDFTTIYLQDVVVTKKYDTYIFIRDDTGSMMIYDAGDGTGHRYGSGLKNGDVLHGVRGKFRNYFGVPELTPATAWNTLSPILAEPEMLTHVDSTNVCHFIRLENAIITDGTCLVDGQSIPVIDAFNTGIIEGIAMTLDAIVYISWDQLQLWLVSQQTPTDMEAIEANENGPRYTILGQPVDRDYHGVVILPSGQKRLF